MPTNKYNSNGEEAVINTIAGTRNTSGELTVISALGSGLAICLTFIKIQGEGLTIPMVVFLKSGSTVRQRYYSSQAGDGVIVLSHSNRSDLALGDNQPLIIDLSESQQINYEFHWEIGLPR